VKKFNEALERVQQVSVFCWLVQGGSALKMYQES